MQSKQQLGSFLCTFLVQCDPYWPRTFAWSQLIDHVKCGIPVVSKHPAGVGPLIIWKRCEAIMITCRILLPPSHWSSHCTQFPTLPCDAPSCDVSFAKVFGNDFMIGLKTKELKVLGLLHTLQCIDGFDLMENFHLEKARVLTIVLLIWKPHCNPLTAPGAPDPFVNQHVFNMKLVLVWTCWHPHHCDPCSQVVHCRAS